MRSEKKERRSYWIWVVSALLFRIILICFPTNLNLGSRPEVATPVTSLRRLAEGYWLKQSSMSPYSGSMYHGSPLLLHVVGPLTALRFNGSSAHIFCSLLFAFADLLTALLIRATGQKLCFECARFSQRVDFSKSLETSGNIAVGNVASLLYLWNPLTIITCVGSSTSPMENLMVVLSLYGACSRIAPLAAFGWVFATHLSLYPMILIVPVILLFGYGPDTPPEKLLQTCSSITETKNSNRNIDNSTSKASVRKFLWKPVLYFLLWALLWSIYTLVLSGISLKGFGSLGEMFKKTYGFILTVEDLSPNLGILWYFFAEVFVFFRVFFLMVFHMNILFMLLPLAIRLNHRPCFLAFVYVAISSMLKSYPSTGDAALYLGLLALFLNEVKDIRLSFFLFCGYIGVFLLSPVMHNLWIWRGTGNANFYFATGLAYACVQTVLLVESVSAMLNHDRTLRKQLTT